MLLKCNEAVRIAKTPKDMEQGRDDGYVYNFLQVMLPV